MHCIVLVFCGIFVLHCIYVYFFVIVLYFNCIVVCCNCIVFTEQMRTALEELFNDKRKQGEGGLEGGVGLPLDPKMAPNITILL